MLVPAGAVAYTGPSTVRRAGKRAGYEAMWQSMDVIAIVAEHKIQTAMEDGLFDDLPARGRIACAKRGESFFVEWWREKIAAASMNLTAQRDRLFRH